VMNLWQRRSSKARVLAGSGTVLVEGSGVGTPPAAHRGSPRLGPSSGLRAVEKTYRNSHKKFINPIPPFSAISRGTPISRQFQIEALPGAYPALRAVASLLYRGWFAS
jgi:hypothetical protein